ncbi:MAG: HU family DNA-binding protein [Bacteroidota bacterium]
MNPEFRIGVTFVLYATRRCTMNRTDLISRIAEGTGLSKVETEVVLDGFFQTVRETVAAGEAVEIRGFGQFKPKHRKAREGRHPKTQAPLTIAARVVPSFQPARAWLDQMPLPAAD